MDVEASSFETSEMLATLLTSTPLLSESWRLCGVANRTAPESFVTERIGDVAYVAFSGIQTVSIAENEPMNLVPLNHDGPSCLFSSLNCHNEDKEVAMVLAGLLNVFISIFSHQNLQNQRQTDIVYLRDDLKALNNSHCKKFEKVAQSTDLLCPSIKKKLVKLESASRNWSVVFAGAGRFQVKNRYEQFVVDINLGFQISIIMETSKSFIITGHSIGGAAASLCALWLLCLLRSKTATPPTVLCITFGSPLLGNDSLSKAILRERWGGNFCHVVSVLDVMPRLLFAPLTTLAPQLNLLQRYWNLSMTSEQHRKLATQLSEKEKSGLFLFVLTHLRTAAEGGGEVKKGLFWPFGNFLFCSENGAVCLENSVAVVKMMHLMLATRCPSDSIEDHLKYGDYVGKLCLQFLKKQNSMKEEDLPDSSYEASVALALESCGMAGREPIVNQAKDCLRTARRMTLGPNLNSAKLAISLSNIVPYRAQIEWYKASCEESDDQLGYYDSFKHRGASKKGSKMNMNRQKLARFWNEVIHKLENNHFPPNFHKQAKWINSSHFYSLLVEPLDIAEHYRLHRAKGHYLKRGRERRYEIFDRWWREREVGEEGEVKKRSKFASLTQDSCFWARVEEARDWIGEARSGHERGGMNLAWKKIEEFEKYAVGLIENKEVSKDVLAKNSSYSLFVEEVKELRLQI